MCQLKLVTGEMSVKESSNDNVKVCQHFYIVNPLLFLQNIRSVVKNSATQEPFLNEIEEADEMALTETWLQPN